ncbi:hypothetical protein B0I72DRAFT_139640, partial [Yarrowia lipolytica]
MLRLLSLFGLIGYWLASALGPWLLWLISGVLHLLHLWTHWQCSATDLVALVLSYGTYCSLALCPRLRCYCSSDL